MERKKKKVVLNGVEVGEYLSTGDDYADLSIATEILKAKGLYKEITIERAMFDQATAFARIASDVYENYVRGNNPGIAVGAAPFVVNAAFAIEIYLKTLAVIHGGSLRGHSLGELFSALPVPARTAAEAVAASKYPGFAIEKELVALGDPFSEWRYAYEKDLTGKVTLGALVTAADVLHRACVASGIGNDTGSVKK